MTSLVCSGDSPRLWNEMFLLPIRSVDRQIWRNLDEAVGSGRNVLNCNLRLNHKNSCSRSFYCSRNRVPIARLDFED